MFGILEGYTYRTGRIVTIEHHTYGNSYISSQYPHFVQITHLSRALFLSSFAQRTMTRSTKSQGDTLGDLVEISFFLVAICHSYCVRTISKEATCLMDSLLLESQCIS